jgi:hypothetical protein
MGVNALKNFPKRLNSKKVTSKEDVLHAYKRRLFMAKTNRKNSLGLFAERCPEAKKEFSDKVFGGKTFLADKINQLA